MRRGVGSRPRDSTRSRSYCSFWSFARFAARHWLIRAFLAMIAFCLAVVAEESTVEAETSESSDSEGDRESPSDASSPSTTGSSGESARGPCLLPWPLRRGGRFGAAFGAG